MGVGVVRTSEAIESRLGPLMTIQGLSSCTVAALSMRTMTVICRCAYFSTWSH